jgi:hypothetical protein
MAEAPAPIKSPANSSEGITAISDEGLLRRFIGPNQDYYIRIWTRNVERGGGLFGVARRWTGMPRSGSFPGRFIGKCGSGRLP